MDFIILNISSGNLYTIVYTLEIFAEFDNHRDMTDKYHHLLKGEGMSLFTI